ncbi:DNA replication ATP-dependent helicase Dna2 [Ceratobasidium sp. AG-Ba]|nr:DNA replication ATP-dependent helicase Dna2 [Ceratobasidium sp. AG-Ba]
MPSDYGDEDDFMNNLLADMDESLLRTPVKPPPSSAPQVRQKPVARPMFSSQGTGTKSQPTKSRKLATPRNSSAVDVTATFTPAVMPDDELYSTSLSDYPELMDDIEDPVTPPPEEQLPKRVTAKTPAPPNPAPAYHPDPVTRCVLKKLEKQEIGWRHQIRALAIKEGTEEVVEIILKDDWVTTRLRIGDLVNVLGDLTELPQRFKPSSSQKLVPTSTITISSQQNTLVVHPDLLLPITSISNASICPRKPLLTMLVPTPTFPPSLAPLPSLFNPGPETSELDQSSGKLDKSQEPLIWGTLLHEVVQDCLATGTWSKAGISAAIRRVLRNPASLSQLFRVDKSLKEAADELTMRAGGLEGFARKYISGAVPPEEKKEKEEVEITGLHTVEEEIWSTAWGLRGKIDAAVEAVVDEPPAETKGISRSASAGSSSQGARNLAPSGVPRSKSSVEPRAKPLVSQLGPSAVKKERVKGGLADAIKRGLVQGPSSTQTTWTMPFEIKTGRTVGGMEHRAQTMLYTILIAERYGVETPTGILYYTQKDEIIQVHPARNELRGLIMGRNELAASIMHRRALEDPETPTEDVEQPKLEEPSLEDTRFLPPPIDEDHQCTRCYARDACTLYRAAVEGLPPSPVPKLKDKTSHLTPAQAEFFARWETLIALEEQDMVRFRKELWTMGAEKREKLGRCFARMIPGPCEKHEGKYVYSFTRAPPVEDAIAPVIDLTAQSEAPKTPQKLRPTSSIIDLTTPPAPRYRIGDQVKYSFGSVESLLNGHIVKGDAVTISLEPGLLAFARGYVIDITTDNITVIFDQELPLEGVAIRRHAKTMNGPIAFRIDLDDYSGGMARLRSNLAAMFYNPGDERRLRLVVDLASPRFRDAQDDEPVPAFRERNLNPNQLAALKLVLRAQDYSLVLGMPGTGKTTMVAELIRELVRRGKSVLLTSYTHSAVDTILLKLLDADFGILRLGNVDKIHLEARKFALDTKNPPETLEALERILLRPPVVATTCLSIEHPLFARRTFDYCIVDEASQITLPTCVGPLRFAETFVLVGDHFQLPPLVKSKEARRGGMDVSLFRRLSDAHPEAVVDLALQYRMNEEIMTLSNHLIYGNRLRCGNEQVANQALFLARESLGQPWHATCGSGPNLDCWLDELVDPRCKVRFVDTDELPARNTVVGSLVQNDIEAELVAQTVESLIRLGVKPSQIGIISVYRQQIKLLAHILQAHDGVEILTADRSQGRDKDCIIISMVRSNEDGNIGDLLKDWRRLNVSFTRARSKLIIFGSRSTLKCDQLLEQFFELVDENHWYTKLPKDAHLMHDFAKAQNKRPSSRLETSCAAPEPSAQRVPAKRARVGEGVLKGRPLLQEIIDIDD